MISYNGYGDGDEETLYIEEEDIVLLSPPEEMSWNYIFTKIWFYILRILRALPFTSSI